MSAMVETDLVTNDADVAPAGEQVIALDVDRRAGLDDLVLHVRFSKEGQLVFERDLRGNSEDELTSTCEEAALKLQIQADLLEPGFADSVIRERRQWLKEREARQTEPGPAPQQKPAEPDKAVGLPQGFQGRFVELTGFLATEIRPQWLVKQLAVRDQVGVLGGSKKTLKTSLLVDFAVSVATGTPFLSHPRFAVPEPLKVALISGESGPAAIQNQFHRVANARGAKFEADRVFLGFDLPRLSNTRDLRLLTDVLKQHQVQVAILDPLYLSLLSGNTDANPANVFAMGPLLLEASRSCLRAGATPLFCHHSTKGSYAAKSRTGDPLDLEDLAFSGVAEVARQWLIVSHREPFNAETGESKLWLRVGGSAGHSGLYALDIDEGTIDDDFKGRRWQVKVESASKAIEASAKAKEDQKQQAKRRQDLEDMKKIETALAEITVGKTVPEIGDLAGFGKDKTRRLLAQLLRESRIVCTRVSRPFGSGNRNQPGWRLFRPGERGFTTADWDRLHAGEFIEDLVANVTPDVGAHGEAGPDGNGQLGAAVATVTAS